VKPTYFKTPSDFREWLAENHARCSELWVGFQKKTSAKPSVTYPEAVEQALCFGWIDGVRHPIDKHSYKVRFTPRRPHSNWSAINIRRAETLTKLGAMHPSGSKAFAEREERPTRVYSFENKPKKLTDEYARKLNANASAKAFFESQPPSYQRTAIFWVMSAKKEETRLRRLMALINDSADRERIAPLRRPVHEK
jgi:uncharacterized protein YdeI (YjbR/CyaY-like superfamily)